MSANHRGGYLFHTFSEGLNAAVEVGATRDGGISKPISNVNLIRLRESSGRTSVNDKVKSAEVLQEYWRGLGRIITDAAIAKGRVVFSGEVTGVIASTPALRAMHPWDGVIIVEYPSLEHYRKVINTAAFHDIKGKRNESVMQSILYVTVATCPHDQFRDLGDKLMRSGTEVTFSVSSQNPSNSMGWLEGRTLLRGEPGHSLFKYFGLHSGSGTDLTTAVQLIVNPIPIDEYGTVAMNKVRLFGKL